MEVHDVIRRLGEARDRLEVLQRGAEEAGAQDGQLLECILQDFESGLEALRVADEELRQQNAELQHSRELIELERRRYHDLFEAAPDAYIVTDIEAVVQEANRAAVRLLNMRPHWLVGKPLVVFIAEEDRRGFHAELGRLPALTGKRDWVLRLHPRSSGALTASVTVDVEYDGEGRALGLRWLVRDVTKQRSAEEEIRVLNAELERRVAERTAELAEKEGRLRLALEAARLGTWDWNLLTGEVAWSDEAGTPHVLPAGPDGPGYKALLSDVHPEDRERLIQGIARSIEEETGYDLEYRVVHADGRVRWREGKGRVHRDPETGRAVRLIGVWTDITERKRAEQLQSAHYGVSRALAEAGGVSEAADRVLQTIGDTLEWEWGAMWQLDRGAGVLVALRTWRAAGVDAPELEALVASGRLGPGEDLPGRVLEHATPIWVGELAGEPRAPRALAAVGAGLRSAVAVPVLLKGQVLGVLEFMSGRVRPADSDALTFLTSIGHEIGAFLQRALTERELSAVKDELAVQLGDMTRLHDLSARLSTTLELQPLLDEVLRAVTMLQGTSMGVLMLVPPEGGELYTVASTGFTQEQLDGLERLPGGGGACALAVAARAPLIVEDVAHDLRFAPHLQGRGPAWRAVHAIPLLTRSGAIMGAIATYFRRPRPPSEREMRLLELYARQAAEFIENARLYLQAQEANRAKDEFLATLSHELRTPLNAITGWIHLLRTGSLDQEARERALETIDRNVRQQAQLIEDLLDVSRIISGKLRLEKQPVQLADVVERAVDSVRLAAEAKQLELVMELGAPGWPILGDPDRLQQVVWNLLSNAIKFTPREGRVEIRLARGDNTARIAVSDTGKGIRREFLPHVFERFRQAEGTSMRSHAGLGLGLAIVRHLVELHGGEVRAESLGEGRGATFTVELPLRPGVAGVIRREPADAARPDAGGDGCAELEAVQVLVVEDEADTRELLRQFLEGCGARVTTAGSAPEALAEFRRSRPDVLLMDIAMPGEDGYELLRKIRAREAEERSGSTPAVALTAYARSEDRQRAFRAGFQRHVSKPVQPAVLAEIVAELGRARGNGPESRPA